MFSFNTEYNDFGKFVSNIHHIESGISFKGAPAKKKKETEHDACKQMWKYISEGDFDNDKNACGAELKYDALLGDKVLDYALALVFHKQTKDGSQASDLHNLISQRSRNENLRDKMHLFNLTPSDNPVVDASRVEQHVWKIHQECEFNIFETIKRLEPLINL